MLGPSDATVARWRAVRSGPMAADLEAEVDRLYRLPLEEFVRARDELARRLRGEGSREEAAQVKALPKPTAAAWAVNQLARSNRREVDLLLDAAHRLRTLQASSPGRAERASLEEALRAHRKAVSSLTDIGEALLASRRG